MSLKNLIQRALPAALVVLGAASVVAETNTAPVKLAAQSAVARPHRPARGALSETPPDDLIRDILGVAASKSTQEALAPNSGSPFGRRQVLATEPALTAEEEKAAETAAQPTARDGGAVFKLAARQPETSPPPTAAKPASQNGNGSMFGRVIRVDVDTNTVDIQFEGRRQTTVGSKFSVEHDYAFTTEYLGKLEIVYLAGGNRAIAKPVDKADITRMGKGDRVGGRVVPNKKGTPAGEANQSTTGGASARAGMSGTDAPQAEEQSYPPPSCVKPPVGDLPQPPPDPAIPYAPEAGGALEEPPPAPKITQATPQHGAPLANDSAPIHEAWSLRADTLRQLTAATSRAPFSPAFVGPGRRGAAQAAPREKSNGLVSRSWNSLIKPNRNSPAAVLSALPPAKSPTTVPWRSKPLWCAAQPRPAVPAGPAQAIAPAPPPPAIVLFENQ